MSKRYKSKVVTYRPRKHGLDPTALLVLGGIVLISAAIIIIVWFALAPNRNANGTPQLQVNTERLDLGKQTFNNTVRASFSVKNVGTGTLTLNVPRSATLLEGC
ncbi:hypothetical protein FBQ82_01135 [Anaerolineae bacterium CFX7]|nr:hypothetical protein [Anaerolineae bacterium CFX7]